MVALALCAISGCENKTDTASAPPSASRVSASKPVAADPREEEQRALDAAWLALNAKHPRTIGDVRKVFAAREPAMSKADGAKGYVCMWNFLTPSGVKTVTAAAEGQADSARVGGVTFGDGAENAIFGTEFDPMTSKFR